MSMRWLIEIVIKYIQTPDVIENPVDKLDGEVDKVQAVRFSHIVVNRKNQEEIFASLSKNDFKKIISNLED